MQRKWQVLLVVGAGAFIASLDLFIVNIAFPDLAADFGGTDLGTLSWVLNAYTIVYAALLIPAGRWADAFGRKRVFLIGLGIFSAASAACALAPNVETLVVLRALQAVGAALVTPTSLGLLLPEFPPEQRAMAVTLWAATGAVAAAAGPPIGGVLVQASWHWVFLVNVPVGIAAMVAGARILREVRDPATTRPDAVGAVLLAAGVAALVGALVQGGDWGWGDGRTVGLFAAAATLAAVVVARCRTHPAPVVDPALVRVRAFSVAVVAAVVFYAGFGAMLLTSVLLLTGPWGQDVLTAGLMIAPGPTMAALFSVPGAKLARRHGMAVVGVAGSALFALGSLIWAAGIGPDVDYAGAFLPGMVVGGAGVGLVIPTVTAAAAIILPPERFATGSGVVSMGRQLGLAVGVAILVALLGTPRTAADFDPAFVFIVVTSLGSGALLAALGRVEAHAGMPAAAPA